MKKIVIFLLCSMFLYGADLQVANLDLKEFKNAKELQFVEANPAQLTINVPVDLDVIKGRKSENGRDTATGSYTLWCYIWSDKDDHPGYSQGKKEVQPGKQTVTFKFNGISYDRALTINKYRIVLYPNVEAGYRRLASIFDSLKIDNTYIEGTIE